jgi:NAD(P)-dependent dehydrogenase (short-subunit alcohol dehydrogenase family)
MSEQRFVLITGATDGIGRAAAKRFAADGWFVLIHGRDEAKLRATQSEIAAQTGSDSVDWVRADFASLADVRALGAYLVDNYDRLDVLINNAGTLQQTRQLSQDGHELTFAVNHLAPFALTAALLPALRATASAQGQARVLNVAANGHLKAALDFDDLQYTRDYDGVKAYQRSKLANVLFTKRLARQLDGSGVAVHALHPGVITTKVLMAGFGITGADPADAAAAMHQLATSQQLAGQTGRYFDVTRERKGVAATQDQDLQERLWAVSEALVKV